MNDLDICLEVVYGHVNRCVASHSPLNISETVRDRGFNWFQKTPIGNGLWGIESSRDWWRYMTLKGQTRGPVMPKSTFSGLQEQSTDLNHRDFFIRLLYKNAYWTFIYNNWHLLNIIACIISTICCWVALVNS